jgi:cysteine-rich repeat protein
MDQGSAGNPSPPDMTSMAGAGVDEGTAGSAGMKPADPVCGNGMLEAGEECDDAGHAGQDGCDENCKVVCAQLGAGTLESEDHHCYNGYDQGSFKESQDACVKRGAHLATISSAAENKLAQSLVHGSKWLGGLEDVAVTAEGTGAYGWITKEPFTFTNWAPHEPNREQTRCNVGPTGRCFEHCVSINGDGTWADRPCDMVDGYVCEWEPAGQ